MFVLFGLAHAVAVVANHYFSMWMKRTLGPARYKEYNDNRLVNAVATVLTFLFVAATFSLFANSYDRWQIILQTLTAA
jgi:D-alanyl-lipoteichoic acid acyltransferase DltB (MBOAT superfamily)